MLKNLRPAAPHRLQGILGELPGMRALLDNHKLVRFFELFPDFAKLRRQQFPEERADTDIGEVIAFTSQDSAPTAVITLGGMIEGLFHEPGEGNRAARPDFVADQFRQDR